MLRCKLILSKNVTLFMLSLFLTNSIISLLLKGQGNAGEQPEC